MTLAETSHPAACPGCLAAPDPGRTVGEASDAPKAASVGLALPGIHCAGCISGVERTLASFPGVSSARVNLTLKRVLIDTDGIVTPEALIERLDRSGYEAHELDATSLAATGSDRDGRDLAMRLAVAFLQT